MISKTRLLALIKSFKWKDVRESIRENAALLAIRDERGRNWLHICCGTKPKSPKQAADGVKTASELLEAGLGINDEAFSEGNWKATPLWFAVARGENLALAEFLLERGANPNYCLWAASFRNDLAAIRLLVKHGADVNDPCLDESPLLGAIKYSKFPAAAELLRLGANADYRDSHGMTALHYMLKKGSDKKHFRTFVAHGARGNIADAAGRTAAEIMRRKKDPDFRAMASELR